MCVDPMEWARERRLLAVAEKPQLVWFVEVEDFLPPPMHLGDLYHEHEPRRKMVEGDLYA